MSVQFQKYRVVNRSTKQAARVWYSVFTRVTDGKKCVTLYAKDYSDALGAIFADQYENNTDLMTDYFDKGKVVLFEDHPLYLAALERAEQK